MGDCDEYKEAIWSLTRWYSSEEKKERILTALKNMTLTKDMEGTQTLSEVAVLRTFVAKLMFLQN